MKSMISMISKSTRYLRRGKTIKDNILWIFGTKDYLDTERKHDGQVHTAAVDIRSTGLSPALRKQD